MEFILLHTPNDHSPSIDELRKIVLRSNPDLKDKPLFWKRKASVLKVRRGGGGGIHGASQVQSVLKVKGGGMRLGRGLTMEHRRASQGALGLSVRLPLDAHDGPPQQSALRRAGLDPLPPPAPSSQAHLLLLAFLERDESAVPANVQADLKFVLQKSPLLLEEMLKIAAALPRAPHGYGWLVRRGGEGRGRCCPAPPTAGW